jgi:hypothetical protein
MKQFEIMKADVQISVECAMLISLALQMLTEHDICFNI